ncbi:gluconate 2-dehydrogenase subunit 3 family protein [Salinimicrobium sp. GXAS 041]|uniref:gluconate 2-dehydrogenase subunit 3 family protein n=1 Tax=Salinimicrobium sp. GXAS 041 TaxID=3400806 RepID=UPI003C71918C
MKRRNLLKVLGLSAVGVATVPLWMDSWSTDDLPADTSEINDEQKLVLAELVDTYIPAGEIPGAKELEVDRFIIAMVDGCFQKDIQKEFLAGFNELEKVSKENFEKPFTELSEKQKIKVITILESAEKNPEKKINFVSFIKDLTVTGYMSSQYILENHLGYEFIPGRFNGSFPVEKTVYTNA